MSSRRRLVASLHVRLVVQLVNHARCSAEYRSKILTKLAGGNRYAACYGLAVAIFTAGIFRDHLCVHTRLNLSRDPHRHASSHRYQTALGDQPSHPFLHYTEFKLLAAVLFLVGSTLVITSTWALGITGTFLGDYCVRARTRFSGGLRSEVTVRGVCRNRVF